VYRGTRLMNKWI